MSSPAKYATEASRLRELLSAIRELSSELELDVLLTRAMAVCTHLVDADRSSLFLYDRKSDELWSKIAQGLDTLEIRFPASKGLAGVCAREGKIINVPDAYADERFNREFDLKTGYHTRSVLCVPMKDARGHVLGVIQTLNKLDGGPFDAKDEELLSAFGSHIAVFVENAQLYESIERLFEAFVSSSSTAIDERDPATAGHSRRVARYALNLARAAHAAGLATFTRARLRQLRYAALLHDFGKVGVRESVLCKRNKLSDDRMEAITERLKRKALEQKIHFDLQTTLELLSRANTPAPLSDADAAKLAELREAGLLTSAEAEALSIRRGNLTPEEWDDMKSHAERGRNILSKIPWPEDLARVPELAYMHHERPNGSGYPQGLKGDQIDIDARILGVADVYDALTAQDRPYKPAFSHEKARAILEEEASAGKLDASLVKLFFERELYKIEWVTDTRMVAQAG